LNIERSVELNLSKNYHYCRYLLMSRSPGRYLCESKEEEEQEKSCRYLAFPRFALQSVNMMSSQSPAFKRFLSDFTLGFSDGLTVPFALTAGLSSLGKTDTVITGGLAELCAGSISMGIGGYLAARDEYVPSLPDSPDDEDLRARSDFVRSGEIEPMVEGSEKIQARMEDIVRRHLEPLDLPPSTIISILDTIQQKAIAPQRTILRLETFNNDIPHISQNCPASPVTSGLSISLGYAVGGIIPLLPYFFTSTVGSGLQLSTFLCLAVLFTFGAGKKWMLTAEDDKMKGCVVEGLQMLVLGALAAGAAVLCVSWLGRIED
jgi:VIT1/CCC1 family predicted Fe2+/Mn2+ transporter